jgi:hypothetical protein
MYLNPPFWPSERQAIYAHFHSFPPLPLLELTGGRRPSHLAFQFPCELEIVLLGRHVQRSLVRLTPGIHIRATGEEARGGPEQPQGVRFSCSACLHRAFSPFISVVSPSPSSVSASRSRIKLTSRRSFSQLLLNYYLLPLPRPLLDRHRFFILHPHYSIQLAIQTVDFTLDISLFRRSSPRSRCTMMGLVRVRESMR